MRRFVSSKCFPLWAIAALTLLQIAFRPQETHPTTTVCTPGLDLAHPIPAWFTP